MLLGAVLPHNEIGTDPGAVRAYLQGIEALGVTHLLVYDHVMGVDPARPGGLEGSYGTDVAYREPLAFLAFAAGVTTTVELVTTVLILPQRQTVLVAKQAAEVAVLSGGRLRLGIGIGWNRAEYQGLGVPFAQRGARFAEQVEVLRMLWANEAVTFHGRFHTIEHAGINPRPGRPVPLWFGGSAPAALARCARLGDGFMPLGGANPRSAGLVEAIRAHRAEAGLTMEGFGVQGQAQYAGGTPERWRTAAEKWRAMGATHLALATHNAGPTDADGHVARVAEFLSALSG